jgi:hypothetical protein
MHFEHYTRITFREPTLEELKEKVEQINEAIDSVSKCDIPAETKALIITELRNKKAELINLMHKKVNEL